MGHFAVGGDGTMGEFEVIRNPAARKTRPYKVDYIDVTEVVGDKAPVHYRLVRVPTAEEAKDLVRRMSIPLEARLILGARRFYKKLPKENPTPVALEDLFDGVRAVEVMEQIEASLAKLRASVVTPVAIPAKDSTEALLADLAGWDSHDKHEQIMDTFVQTPTTDQTPRLLKGEIVDSFIPPTEPVDAATAVHEWVRPNDKTVTMMDVATPWPQGQALTPETPKRGGNWLLFPTIIGIVIAFIALGYIIRHCGH